jgi:elongation factor G
LELPQEIAAEVCVLRAELADVLAEEDELVFQCLARNEEPAAELLLAALRRRTLEGTLLAVGCGSALHQIGIDAALDLVVDYLPSPLDPPPLRATRAGLAPSAQEVLLVPREDQPLVLFAFKLQKIGRREVVFVRVVRGTLARGAQLQVARSAARVSVSALYRPHADHLEPIDCATPGDIVAVQAEGDFESVASGDTLCDLAEVCALEPLEVPKPVLSLAVEPAHGSDREPLRAGLARLVREDPSLSVREDESSGQWLLAGMGELHLEIALERLRAETGLSVGCTPPRVAYCEVPQRALRSESRIERSFGGSKLAGAIALELTPAPELESVEISFDPAAAPQRAWQPAILATLSSLVAVGPLAGHPLSRARIVVSDLSAANAADSEAGALQAVGSAWHDLLARLSVELHEPVMAFEVLTPSEYAGGVMGDLNARGAQMSEVHSEGLSTRVRGSVPLSGMFGYASAVRSLSQGRAGFSMRPQGTRPVPAHERASRGLNLG